MNAAVTGTPRLLLRVEGFIAFVAALVAYQLVGGSWLLFAGLFLVPDLSMVAYLAGPQRGAAGYNTVHTYLAPALLSGAMALHLIPAFWQAPLVWIGHIGLDRALAFGLKYPEAFRSTHLGQPGNRPPAA